MNERSRWVGLFLLFGCSGQVDLGETQPVSASVVGAELVDFAAVPFGMCALFDDHRAYCWGELGSTLARRAPELDAVALAGAGSQGEICGIDAHGTVSCSLDIHERRVKKLGVLPAVAVSTGFFGGCALGEDGQPQCWGQDYCDGEPTDAWLHMTLPSRAIQVTFSDAHGCAVTEDGKLYCFGSNHEGESGQDPAIPCVGAPVAVPGFDDVQQVALQMDRTCALHANGRVSCFGQVDGVAPDAGSGSVYGLRDVPGLAGVVAIKASRIATCALDNRGTLKCWGASECGALGISEDCGFTTVTDPIAVQANLDIQDFGMDDGLTCALTRDVDIQCWGYAAWDGQARGNPVPRRITFE